MEEVRNDFNALDREQLMSRMTEELPKIRESLGLSQDKIAKKAGIEQDKFRQIESGRRKMKWSEYMSILFVLWNNEIARGLVETKGLFPKELRQAMSVNRNAHNSKS